MILQRRIRIAVGGSHMTQSSEDATNRWLEMERLLETFFQKYPDDAYRSVARDYLSKLVVNSPEVSGQPGGWAGGLVYAISAWTPLQRRHVIRNAEFEELFGTTMRTIRKRAELVWQIVEAESSDANGPTRAPFVEICGFRVQSYGRRVSPSFRRGLRRLSERGFADASCIVVKTESGPQSGITHAGGRYVPPDSSFRAEVIRQMRTQGMEPPPPPFIIAPGESTLYHEWGHHVDWTWSNENQGVRFSFAWFSRFYQLLIRSPRIARSTRGFQGEQSSMRPIESELEAAEAVAVWWHSSSELFANLFEDWMRGAKKVAWDQCEPQDLNRPGILGQSSVTIELVPGVRAENVRAETYQLFAAGIRSVFQPPPVRPDLLGANTDETISRLCCVLELARAGRL